MLKLGEFFRVILYNVKLLALLREIIAAFDGELGGKAYAGWRNCGLGHVSRVLRMQ
jgi:hypothetical protein